MTGRCVQLAKPAAAESCPGQRAQTRYQIALAAKKQLLALELQQRPLGHFCVHATKATRPLFHACFKGHWPFFTNHFFGLIFQSLVAILQLPKISSLRAIRPSIHHGTQDSHEELQDHEGHEGNEGDEGQQGHEGEQGQQGHESWPQ